MNCLKIYSFKSLPMIRMSSFECLPSQIAVRPFTKHHFLLINLLKPFSLVFIMKFNYQYFISCYLWAPFPKKHVNSIFQLLLHGVSNELWIYRVSHLPKICYLLRSWLIQKMKGSVQILN